MTVRSRTTRSRTLGRAGIVAAAAAAGLLATSGTASASILTVAAIPTPGVESISTVVTAVPLITFNEAVECTVTATGSADATNTASETGTLSTAGIGTIVIDGLEPGLYTVSATCDDGGTPVDSLVSLPVTVLPEGELPPVVPPVPGGGSLPTDLFES